MVTILEEQQLVITTEIVVHNLPDFRQWLSSVFQIPGPKTFSCTEKEASENGLNSERWDWMAHAITCSLARGVVFTFREHVVRFPLNLRDVGCKYSSVVPVHDGFGCGPVRCVAPVIFVAY